MSAEAIGCHLEETGGLGKAVGAVSCERRTYFCDQLPRGDFFRPGSKDKGFRSRRAAATPWWLAEVPMRIAALAFVSVLALAACSPSAPSSSSGTGTSASNPSAGGASGGGFPQGANVAFRQEATMTIPGAGPMAEVIYH